MQVLCLHHLILVTDIQVDNIISVLCPRSPGVREVSELSLGHEAAEWQSHDSNKIYGTSKPVLLTPSLSHGVVSESRRVECGLGIPSTRRGRRSF